jgi:transcriptional regulator with XRE-family HTH domain
LRQAQQLTLQEMSAALGISHQQLQKYETGTNRLSAGMMPGVAEILGVDIADLFISEASSRTGYSEADKLRSECGQVLRRTSSSETLKTMSRVLKALSPR